MDNFTISPETSKFASSLQSFIEASNLLAEALGSVYGQEADNIFDSFVEQYYEPMEKRVQELMICTIRQNIGAAKGKI